MFNHRMGFRLKIISTLASVLAVTGCAGGEGSLFPAIFAFGDSANDVGNNNNRQTLFKANYAPYGRDFINHIPTGRFSNGKLAIDYTAKAMGFDASPPAYLSKEASGNNLLNGATFASAGAGYYEATSVANDAISLPQQVELFKEYKGKLKVVAGENKSESIIEEALYIVNAGNADFYQNYYFYPFMTKKYSLESFSSLLVLSFSNFVEQLHTLGARKIGVAGLTAMGCLPAARTLLSYGEVKTCNAKLNDDAAFFNRKLNETVESIVKKLPNLKMVVFDIFSPMIELVKAPTQHGLLEGRKICCQTERTKGKSSVLCLRKWSKLCANSSAHVFWDAVHPTEAANKIIANELLLQGLYLI